MRTASPWWASLIFGIGLVFFLLGERFFGHLAGARFVLTGIGVLLILGITLARAWTTLGSAGARRRVERVLLTCHAGSVLALILYLLSTDWGLNLFGLSETAAVHFHGAVLVLFLAVLIASIVPLIMAELSLGLALRTKFDVQSGPGNEDAGVEYFRVRELGWSGLSVGFALSFLMVTCHVASERNIETDVSYFKTSTPGDSSRKIVASSGDPIRVLLFFPDGNEVKTQVRSYFDALNAGGGGRLQIESRDRLADAELAVKYKVNKDGTVVLIRGTGDKEKSQSIDLDVEISRQRSTAGKLRNFDRDVNAALLKLMRDKRKAYLLVGHGELNDRESLSPELKGRVPSRPATQIRARLSALNYEVKNLALIDLAKDVPDDATVVLALAPALPLLPGEWASLERYLDRGGRLLFALDPKGAGSLGPLEAKLTLKMIPGDLSDEEKFLPQRRNKEDHRLVLTNQFSAHATTTAVRGTDRQLILIDSGALEDVPFTGKPEDAPKKTVTIRSLESSFMDLNDNAAFDAGGPEKKQRWTIAAAVEGAKHGDKDGYRALVFADVDLFADIFIADSIGRPVAMMVSDYAGGLLDDSIRWLGGEEVFSGEVVSEDDKPIQHTKNEDVVWFVLMIIGAPILVLTLGLVGTTRRRRASKKTEVTQ
jgi:hypothetical protein